MNYKAPLFVIVSAVLLAACNNSSSPGTRSNRPVNLTIPTNTGPGQFQSKTTTPLPGTTTQPIVPVSNTAVGLNPEHGKPGHRCDIAVGAPLNSKPNTTTAATTANSTPVTISTPQTVNEPNTFVAAPTTKAGLNPEHGKPGHRCDIAVGAPLDSKPTAPVVKTTDANNTQVVSSIPAATPVLPEGTTITTPGKTDIVPADGLNPEHGKPGHRCDIAVGAPLNSKPVEKKN